MNHGYWLKEHVMVLLKLRPYKKRKWSIPFSNDKNFVKFVIICGQLQFNEIIIISYENNALSAVGKR